MATINHYRQTRFLLGVTDPCRAPPDSGAEVAFAGRSNAGKSSALNVITEQRALARISKAPGRTREINFFRVSDDRRLVDLPGYGYARVSKAIQARWQQHIDRYLETRASLCGLVLLMDVRHPMNAHDRQILGWCRTAALPTHVLLTKADKLKHGPAKSTLLQVHRQLQAVHPAATAQLFSAHTREGREEVQAVLDRWLGLTEDL
ncbi:MAG: ribosome biogenesis GTP-binding protein YihA/YsxC [Gammaproteobacteria bacterium]|jgi:GTP-binding protein